jgi:hypothetical protein
MPDFGWHRFPSGISRADLPRLITPRTIVFNLETLLADYRGASDSSANG